MLFSDFFCAKLLSLAWLCLLISQVYISSLIVKVIIAEHLEKQPSGLKKEQYTACQKPMRGWEQKQAAENTVMTAVSRENAKPWKSFPVQQKTFMEF